MFRPWFYSLSAAAVGLVVGVSLRHPGAWWALLPVGPIILLGFWDIHQQHHTILRNFPVIGHGRYLFEMFRPEIQQYFVESNIDGRPIEREFRNIVYQRAKGDLETQPFGTQRDIYRTGYEWACHSMAPAAALDEEPRLMVGGPDCKHPYSASLLNISAMSFGALSSHAVLALNQGARQGGFAHNTGEGGLSPYHLEPGGDLIWQIGTGYFGCRTPDGRFDPERFAQQAARPQVRMIELKLSQGAKPGHGGILPACKVTPEIARIRGVPPWETVFSPPGHSVFSTPRQLVLFLAELRDLSGGKPVGFKLCVGRRGDFLAICKAMIETGSTPDFITVDGGEGGTGAAPLEFSNSVGMPGRDAVIFVQNALTGAGLRNRIRLLASGKILTGFHMIRALALGADACLSARGMMLALGCIQALRCNNDTCPTGITTQNKRLVHGLDVDQKARRVARYHKGTLRGFLDLLGAMGLRRPEEVRPYHIFRRVDDLRVRQFAELYDFLEDRQLVEGGSVPHTLWEEWQAARPDRWATLPEKGRQRLSPV
ncbi:MAG: FMN-binding glutamate synthase family protein [Acidobacteriota bacterium]